jgi:hypothetical protein
MVGQRNSPYNRMTIKSRNMRLGWARSMHGRDTKFKHIFRGEILERQKETEIDRDRQRETERERERALQYNKLARQQVKSEKAALLMNRFRTVRTWQ